MSSPELAQLEELLGRVLPDPMGYAERVMQQMAARMSTEGSSAPDDSAFQALVDRNLLRAAAVGACECWGEEQDCPNCAGEGTAGWLDPDPDLYAEYVAPAVVRMSGAPARNDRITAPPTAGEHE